MKKTDCLGKTIERKQDKFQPCPLDMVICPNREAFFIAANFNGIFKWDMKAGEITFLREIPVIGYKNQLYANGLQVGNKIFFPPRTAKRLLIYDINTNGVEFTDIYLPFADHDTPFPNAASGFIIFEEGGKIYMICRQTPFCIIYDGNTGEMSCIKCDLTGNNILLSRDYVISGKVCYIPVSSANEILRFDMSDETLEFIKIGKEDWKFYSIAVINNDFYILRGDRLALVEWNSREGIKSERSLDEDINKSGFMNSCKLISGNGKIYIIPNLKNGGKNSDVMVYDPDAESVETFQPFERYRDCFKWRVFEMDDKYAYILQNKGDDKFRSAHLTLVSLDIETMEVTELDYPDSGMENEVGEYQRKIAINAALKKDILLENPEIGLPEFLEGLCMGNGEGV